MTQGTEIDEALRMILDRANKAVGSKGEEKKKEERDWGQKEKVLCTVCNHVFDSSEEYARHLDEAGWCHPQTCPYCDFKYTVQKDLDDHIENRHPNTIDENTTFKPWNFDQKKEAKLACPNCERPALVASFNNNLLCQRCGWYGTEEKIKSMWAIQTDLKKPWPTLTKSL